MNDFIKQQQGLAKGAAAYAHPDTRDMVESAIEAVIATVITNTGEELMRLLDGEETETYQETDGVWCGEETVSLDTIKQRITNVTGVE